MIDLWTMAIVTGALAVAGLFCVAISLIRRPVRLADAMTSLESGAVASGDRIQDITRRLDEAPDWDTRMGQWAYSSLRIPLSDGTARALALRGQTMADFHAQKIIGLVAGLAMPQIVWLVSTALGTHLGATPLVVSLVLAAVGYFLPDVAIRHSTPGRRADASEAVFTFFDLVILERLANQSAISSLHAAASISRSMMFTRIADALERAKLEQRPPWAELKRVADQHDLPQVSDLVEVLSLEEQGASLVDALRARVRDLRDAHLTQEKIAAQQVSESMTIWMVIPTLVFGLIFLTPPLLLLAGAS